MADAPDAHAIDQALTTDNIIDITTTGRKTGEARRIEIRFENLDGELIITGTPRNGGKRGWYANLLAEPGFTFHLKRSAEADIPARATPVTDPTERRSVYETLAAKWEWSEERKRDELESWIADSALVRVALER